MRLQAGVKLGPAGLGRWHRSLRKTLTAALVIPCCLLPMLVRAHGAENLHSITGEAAVHQIAHLPERGHASIKVLRHTQSVSIEWVVSAWTLLGFDGLPTTQVEHKLWAQVMGVLFNPQALWIFNEKADCHALEAIVTSPLLMNEAITHQVPDKMHAGPLSDDLTDVPSGQSAKAMRGFFRGRYTVRCVKMSDLERLEVMIFTHFPGVHSADLVLEAGGWVEQAAKNMVLSPGVNTLIFD